MADKPTSQTLIIDSSQAVCQGLFQQLCLKVREPSSPEFGFLYDSIEGLSYQWGTRYIIEVEQRTISRPPQDRGSIQRRLVSVTQTEEDAIGHQYVYESVRITDRTFSLGNGSYRFLGQPFHCRMSQCNALVDEALNTSFVQLVFAYVGGGEIELIEWREVDAP